MRKKNKRGSRVWIPFSEILAVLVFCFLGCMNRAGESGEVGSGYLNIGRRALMGFKETPNGGNITYECSPSGPCVPCAYSEKVCSHSLAPF